MTDCVGMTLQVVGVGGRCTPSRIAVRSWRAAVGTRLYRPLADDDERAAYWLRHTRIGVLLSELAAWAVVGYAMLTTTPARGSLVVLGLAGVVILGTPLLLVLPIAAMTRDYRGASFFYAWSIADTVVVAIISRVDGGATSPMAGLLFLTLAFMAVTYPPAGVVAMGGLMIAAYLLVICAPVIPLGGWFLAVVMAAFTMTCAMISGNQWNAYDGQLLMLRSQEVLAATDPLTGCLNRRAFLERLARAVSAAAGGEQMVLCLIDLDGFKAVNDGAGHAAGDAVLRSVATRLGAAVRETDTVARLGGDEFAVLATVTGPTDGVFLAERVRDAVAAAGRFCGVTGSVGATMVNAADDVHELLCRADAAMYRAKSAGGDRVTAPTV